ncbi:MAG TPA: signal recognition particle protein [Candidatus Marinimicrobia bacterium]|nr:signal recognition particle protein [Candidatus Neomarinimicrobiota bacterium]
MLEQLRDNLDGIFKSLRGQGKITDKHIADAMRDIRRSLLEADVNYTVAKDFIASIREKALGAQVIRSITPGQQIIKIIHEQMIELLGEGNAAIDFGGLPPVIIMVAGLQGSGKTTFVAKLAQYLKNQGKRPMMVAADIYRPAAIDQLIALGKQIALPVYSENSNNAVAICRNGLKSARESQANVLILDTAGRLHIDENMMNELKQIKSEIKPREILFVADGMTGQDAVNAAGAFENELQLTGIVLTKMDGDTRGGAALSIRAVTGKPIKFIGTGEKMSDLEPFFPDRFASRILGKGDVVSLVEKAQALIDEEEAEKLEKKLRKSGFSLSDFQKQLRMIKKMGPLSSLMDMIPGAGAMKNLHVDEKQFVRTEAILNSMTILEKEKPQLINASRRRRIAKGSGTSVADVNRLLNQFEQMRKMLKKMNKIKNPRQMLAQMSRSKM